MKNNPLAISSSASNYLDATHSKYNKRRYGAYLGTASTFNTYVSGACGVYHDHENNLYVVSYTRVSTSGTNATDSFTYGILIEKFDKSGNGSFSDAYRLWAKGFYKNSLRLSPRHVQISNTGYIAIVGNDASTNDAFVLVVNPSGTAEVFDVWSAYYSWVYCSFKSCQWYDSHVGGTPKLQVIGDQAMYIYTGSSVNGMLVRYGGYQTNEDYKSACYNVNMDTAYGYTVLQGYTVDYRPAGTVQYYNGPQTNPYNEIDNNGYYHIYAMIGNGTDNLHKLQVTRSNYYGGQEASGWYPVRKTIDFANVTSWGNSSYKVKNGSYVGQVIVHDSQMVGYAQNNTTAQVLLCSIATKSSSNASNYNTYGLLSLSSTGTVNWFKKIQHYNSSTYLYNDESVGSGGGLSPKARGFAILDGRYTMPVSRAYGYAVPTIINPDTVTVLHIDANGVLQGAIDIHEASSVAGSITWVTCKNDMHGNVFVHYRSSGASSQHYRIIKLPNPAFKRWTGTTTWTEGSAATEATLTVNTSTYLVDGYSELSQSTVGTHYYSNSINGWFTRTRYITATTNNLDVFNHAGSVNDRSNDSTPSPAI